MKGDFTRFTFRPEKRYSQVLMQQGRMQLDADWNEQMSILGYLNQIQAKDLIGDSGTSRTVGGFQINPTPDGKDLVISAGNYYINGILCELPGGTSIVAEMISPANLPVNNPDPVNNPEPTNSNSPLPASLKVKVPVFTVDRQAFKENQWLEILSFAKVENPTDRWFQIKTLNSKDQILELVHPTLTAAQLKSLLVNNKPEENAPDLRFVKLHRLTTYKTQPDYPIDTAIDPIASLLNNHRYVIYLDAWQRHITTLEDPEIKEIALGAADTTTRIKTVWQVKLLEVGNAGERDTTGKQIAPAAPDQNFAAWNELTEDRAVYLTARLRNGTNGTNAQPLDNQLYRIEIHTGGTIQQARFKWSRDNGTLVSAIAQIQPQDNLIQIQDSLNARGFRSGQWIELTNDARELRNQPGILLRLAEVRPGGRLIYDPSTITEEIAPEQFQSAQSAKVRGWDWQQNQPGLSLKSTHPEGWIELEHGIQIQFSADADATFQPGDYWLIPSRLNGSIEWTKDAAGTPLRQAPLGITHFYSRLALLTTQVQNFSLDTLQDARILFPSLVNCLDNRESSFLGDVGIGLQQPEARLHVRSSNIQEGKGRISAAANTREIRGVGTAFLRQLKPEDTLTTVGQNNTSVTIVVESIQSDDRLTAKEPLQGAIISAPFTFQPKQAKPVVRFDTQDATPQFVLTDQGNVGIGTPTPAAKLDINGTLRVSQNNTQVEVGIASNQVQFTTNTTGYRFSDRLTVAEGGLTVEAGGVTVNQSGGVVVNQGGVTVNQGGATFNQGDVAIETGNLNLAQGNVTLTQGNLTLNQGNLTVTAGTATIGSLILSSNATQSSLRHSASGEAFVTLLPSGSVNIGKTVGIGIAAPLDPIKLQVNGTLRIGDATNHVSINHSNNQVSFTATSNSRYHFDKAVTIEAGGITVQDGITLSSGNLTLPASSSLSWGSATLGLTNQTLILGSDNVHFGSGNAKLLQIDANPDNKVVDFTTNQTSGFRFNQSITIAATRLIMQPNSRLGIGIDNPGAILDVRGAVNRAAQPNQIIARFAKDDTSPQLLIAVGEDGDKKLITILGTTGGKLQLGGKDATTPAEDNAIEVKGVLRVERLTTNSSRQLKENISEISSQESSEILKRLSPVKFNYKDDAVPHLGFIAEDVPEILASPDRQSINPVDIVAALAKVVQDHQHTISVLGQVIRRQQESIVTLQERLSQMEQK